MRRVALTVVLGIALSGCMQPEQVAFDPAKMRSDADFTLNLLRQQTNVPTRAAITYQFVPKNRVTSEQSKAFMDAARAAGFRARQPRENLAVYARSRVFTLSGEAIAARWAVLSKLANEHGFKQAGWTF